MLDATYETQHSKMQADRVTVNAQRSAAARTFAIPELLEQIILDVIAIELVDRPKRLMTLPFKLQRISRDFHSTILGSSKILNWCLQDSSMFMYSRLAWLRNVNATWKLRVHRQFHESLWRIELRSQEAHYGFDNRAHASWRNLSWINSDARDPQLEFKVEDVVVLYTYHLQMSKHLGTLRLAKTDTLGQVYDKLEELQSQLRKRPQRNMVK